VADDVALACVAELHEQGYLDDARFVQRFSEDRRHLDGWGDERIRRRLREQGIPEELLGQPPEPQDELEAALAVLSSRVGRAPRDDRERRRALGLLARRGYQLELAYEAVRRFEAGAGRAAGARIEAGTSGRGTE
jgi:regulatory protein